MCDQKAVGLWLKLLSVLQAHTHAIRNKRHLLLDAVSSLPHTCQRLLLSILPVLVQVK